MHELAVMTDILKIVLEQAHKNNAREVLAINLRVGEMTDLEDIWMQRYFGHVSADSIAASARLNILRMPLVFTCQTCRTPFTVEKAHWHEAVCVKCGGNQLKLTAGNEFYIENIEVI